jgi:hypothetical protein
MAENTIARSFKVGRLFDLDAMDWCILIGGVVLVGLLGLLV